MTSRCTFLRDDHWPRHLQLNTQKLLNSSTGMCGVLLCCGDIFHLSGPSFAPLRRCWAFLANMRSLYLFIFTQTLTICPNNSAPPFAISSLTYLESTSSPHLPDRNLLPTIQGLETSHRPCKTLSVFTVKFASLFVFSSDPRSAWPCHACVSVCALQSECNEESGT